jgi:glyoxylase-like metal-dependent hydrolase (beta-lactamase superfamily II)
VPGASANSAQLLADHRAKLAAARGEIERQQARLWMGEYAGVLEALPYLDVPLPGIAFKERLEIHGTQRTAELITFTGGHTASDTVLYLPNEGLVFMSDLLFTGFHPYLAEGDPAQLILALQALSALEARAYIPGHGPVGSLADLKLEIAYIEDCLETAQELAGRDDFTVERINALPLPPRFQHWQVPEFYHVNLRAFYARACSAKSNPQAA